MLSEGKFYSTWGDQKLWYTKALSWLPSSQLAGESQAIFGYDVLRVWPKRRASAGCEGGHAARVIGLFAFEWGEAAQRDDGSRPVSNLDPLRCRLLGCSERCDPPGVPTRSSRCAAFSKLIPTQTRRACYCDVLTGQGGWFAAFRVERVGLSVS